MRIRKALRADQEFTARFLAVLGKGLVIAAQSRLGQPDFFVMAARFIREYIEPGYFRKEEVLLEGLEACGFAPDQGPVGSMRAAYRKSHEISRTLSGAANEWQGGDASSRADVIWATSEFTDLMHQHFRQLNNLIYPLLEQSLTLEEEQHLAEKVNALGSAEAYPAAYDEYRRLIETMEDEVGDWR
jgi:hemerythrin-like domain-containing protein